MVYILILTLSGGAITQSEHPKAYATMAACRHDVVHVAWKNDTPRNVGKVFNCFKRD